MGWMADDPTHEGYLVAIERVMITTHEGYRVPTGEWRDITDAGDTGARDRQVDHLQVACECGWRSQRLVAPLGTRWVPHVTLLGSFHEERADDAAYALWRRHLDDAPAGCTPGLLAIGEHLSETGDPVSRRVVAP